MAVLVEVASSKFLVMAFVMATSCVIAGGTIVEGVAISVLVEVASSEFLMAHLRELIFLLIVAASLSSLLNAAQRTVKAR